MSLAFVRWIHRWPVNSPQKWPVTRKMFPFAIPAVAVPLVVDVIFSTSTSSFVLYLYHLWSCLPYHMSVSVIIIIVDDIVFIVQYFYYDEVSCVCAVFVSPEHPYQPPLLGRPRHFLVPYIFVFIGNSETTRCNYHKYRLLTFFIVAE